MDATVITDASYCPKSHAGAWAAWVTISPEIEGDKPRRLQKAANFRQLASSAYEAELWASLNGINMAVRAGATQILVQTDCLAVVNGLNDKKYNIELTQLGISPSCIKAKHVRGHTRVQDKRSWCNRWCDAEAGKLMKQQRVQLGYKKPPKKRKRKGK